jgi:hypothetical protein
LFTSGALRTMTIVNHLTKGWSERGKRVAHPKRWAALRRFFRGGGRLRYYQIAIESSCDHAATNAAMK